MLCFFLMLSSTRLVAIFSLLQSNYVQHHHCDLDNSFQLSSLFNAGVVLVTYMLMIPSVGLQCVNICYGLAKVMHVLQGMYDIAQC